MSKPVPSQSRVRISEKWKTATKNTGSTTRISTVVRVGAMKKWLKTECRTVARASPGKKTHGRGPPCRLDKLLGDDGHDRADAAVHQGGAETAHHPQRDPVLLEGHEIVNVLDRCEAGADRKADDRRVDQKGDPVTRDQIDDDRALEDFLDDRRDVTREGRGAEIKGTAEFAVDDEACDCCQTTGHDQTRHDTELHQLEAVEQDQREQKGKDRQQSDQDPKSGEQQVHGRYVYRILSEIMNSLEDGCPLSKARAIADREGRREVGEDHHLEVDLGAEVVELASEFTVVEVGGNGAAE